MQSEERIAILGAGSIGTAIAAGVAASGRLAPGQIILRRRRVELLEEARRQGFQVLDNNVDAEQGGD